MAARWRPIDFKGTVKDLSLEPLKTRTDPYAGRVFPSGGAFWLWIDLKDGSPELQEALATLLAWYLAGLRTVLDASP